MKRAHALSAVFFASAAVPAFADPPSKGALQPDAAQKSAPAAKPDAAAKAEPPPGPTPPPAENPVPYPKGYREWQHVKSMVIQKGHPLFDSFGGIHHLYANPKAIDGYKKGKFADGAVIVFDLLEAQEADDHSIGEGNRKVVAVMSKDAAKYKKTGGWGFEAFRANSSSARVVGADAEKACFSCHAPQKDSDYVFSKYRL